MSKLLVSFGEVMLRLAPPGFERFLQSPQFLATFGGGEANVAVAVSGFGMGARYVTLLPPNNPITDAFIGEMGRFGVASGVIKTSGRFGIYYVEPGANQRASKVLYDRAHSSIALGKPGDIDWDKALDGATWFHITGITPAISQGAAELSMESVKVLNVAASSLASSSSQFSARRREILRVRSPVAAISRIASVMVAIGLVMVRATA